jgi:hypothetical protein
MELGKLSQILKVRHDMRELVTVRRMAGWLDGWHGETGEKGR